MTRIVLVCALTLLAACAPVTPPTPADDAFPAPDFTLTALDGETFRLSELRGGWVLLNFWATWCPPCVDEMPALQALDDTYGHRLTVLGINQREDASVVRAFAADHAIRFPLLLNPDDATLLAYQVIGLPQTVLVDPAGNIRFRSFGPVGAELDGALREALG